MRAPGATVAVPASGARPLTATPAALTDGLVSQRRARVAGTGLASPGPDSPLRTGLASQRRARLDGTASPLRSELLPRTPSPSPDPINSTHPQPELHQQHPSPARTASTAPIPSQNPINSTHPQPELHQQHPSPARTPSTATGATGGPSDHRPRPSPSPEGSCQRAPFARGASDSTSARRS